ncbi:MAG TPA: winged helix-turn-helix domain-containing protein [Bacteroidota bacterium]
MVTENGRIRVLLYEEDQKTASIVQRTLGRTGYDVDVAEQSKSAVAKLFTGEYDITLANVSSPERSGYEVLKALRTKSKFTPFLALSENHNSADGLKALEQGADDFLTKPFEEGELCARVQAVLMRSGVSAKAILQARDLTMDTNKRVVQRSSRTLNLTRTEFSLLELLLRNKNVILPRNVIREKVWGSKFDDGTNIVDVYINYLRTSIDREFSPKLIHTVRGKGFMLRED